MIKRRFDEEFSEEFRLSGFLAVEERAQILTQKVLKKKKVGTAEESQEAMGVVQGDCLRVQLGVVPATSNNWCRGEMLEQDETRGRIEERIREQRVHAREQRRWRDGRENIGHGKLNDFTNFILLWSVLWLRLGY